ncbi:polymer-forming cytoskeletal protein [bacterium]|nr:polymer-forming cytoskeletal protein [bacterium]
MIDGGRTRARPSTAGVAEHAAPATGGEIRGGDPEKTPSSTAEEISAQVAGLAEDPKGFKHRISADATISGRIHFPGNARVDGKLKGEIRADALLVVGERAMLEADVRAERLLLRGTVRGSVVCPGFAEFAPGSVVVGDVVASTLLVRPGARIEGACRVGLPITAAAATGPAAGIAVGSSAASARASAGADGSRLSGR